MKLTGAEIVCECLVREGVDTLFGITGGAVLPLFHHLHDYPIHLVQTRHEQGASHAADGYARASGKLGVCVATSGPGATNLVTGLGTAMADSSPLLAITGQVASPGLGMDAFQEVHITGITLPVTKHNFLITKAEDIALAMKRAVHIATSGRPGPVHLDITKDALEQSCEFSYPERVDLRGFELPDKPAERDLDNILEMLEQARRPLVLAGRGVLLSGTSDQLMELLDRGNLPMVSSLLGISAVHDSHPLYFGRAGMHGESHTNMMLGKADLILSLGCRFSDRITGKEGTFGVDARIIQVDMDPVQINKTVPVDLALQADLRDVLPVLRQRVESRKREQWFREIREMVKNSASDDLPCLKQERLLPQFVIREISKQAASDAIVVTDVGQNQQWAAQHFNFRQGSRQITSGGMGTMGFALPAAIGAQLAAPEKEVWVIVGDGGFQMTLCELATAVQKQLPIKIAIINNGYLGMVRQWQELFYDRRYAATELTAPDFVGVASAYGVSAVSINRSDDAWWAIEEALEHPGPALVDFKVVEEANVFPMIAPGSPAVEMIRYQQGEEEKGEKR